VSEAKDEAKERDRKIAENEAERQTIGDIRVSTWAVAAAAVAIGFAAVVWVLIRNH
jgi:hypothetical protein